MTKEWEERSDDRKDSIRIAWNPRVFYSVERVHRSNGIQTKVEGHDPTRMRKNELMKDEPMEQEYRDEGTREENVDIDHNTNEFSSGETPRRSERGDEEGTRKEKAEREHESVKESRAPGNDLGKT